MKALVLLHGFLGSRGDFYHLPIDLKKHYDKVVFPLYPGHGATYKEWNKFNAFKTCQLVIDCFEKLKLEKYEIDVIGYSMGGVIASYIATIYEINHLVLFSPSFKYINLNKIIQFKELKKTSLKKIRNQYFHKNLAHVLKEFVVIVKSCTKHMKVTNTPVLIIWGANDKVVPYSSIVIASSYFSNPKKEIYIDSDEGHKIITSKNYLEILNITKKFLNL